MIVSIYSRNAFREFILPSLRDADHTITLRREEFQLQEDVRLQFEVIGGNWKMRGSTEYMIYEGDHRFANRLLQDQQVLTIRTTDGVQLSAIITERKNAFRPFEKFRLRDVKELTIGRDSSNDIIYDYMSIVSRSHARIYRDGDGFRIENQSPNGSYVNGRKVTEAKLLRYGDYINIVGLHMVFLGDRLAVDTADERVSVREEQMRLSEDTWFDIRSGTGRKERREGKRIYHRAPRAFAQVPTEPVEIVGAPDRKDQRRQSVATVLLPLIMFMPMGLGCFLALFAEKIGGRLQEQMIQGGLCLAVGSAMIGVIWAILGVRSQRKSIRREQKRQHDRYETYLKEKEASIRQRQEETLQLMREVFPDPAACLTFDGSGGLLWNRNRSHEDFLTHRLGLGDVAFPTEILAPRKSAMLQGEDPAKKADDIRCKYQTMHDAPVTVNLGQHRLIGIIGGRERRGAVAVAQVLAAQIAAGNCYTDVKMAFLYDGQSSGDYDQWEFARWLPHVWSEDGKHRYVASDDREASEVLYELTKIFRERKEQDGDGQKTPRPYYVVFVSDQKVLEGEPFTKYMVDRESDLGLTTILLADSYEKLANSCDYILENTETFQGIHSVNGSTAARQAIAFDAVNKDKMEAFGRRLASLQVLEVEESRSLPDQLTFFQMLGIQKPGDLDVRERWAKNRTYDNIRGQLGVKAGGDPCFLDVHEKYHGPHGLVAGTTGSGKSETLQTWMLSLAINYSPDDISFFIIDFKGGGMGNLFRGLPHVVGQISNLSGNQVRRAMISIKSENKRRQRIFNENGVNHIDQYTRLLKDGEIDMPLPHLFIIIDEFAELKREQPEFMTELISVAQLGRSLGVHLILSTQKPGGVVDDNIRSNSRFRICLRVQDRQDSMELLHRADAAGITQAGRGYLQVGGDEVFEQFQSGYSGAAYDEQAETPKTEIARMITCSGRVELTSSSRRVIRGKALTELDAVRDHLIAVARENGYTVSHALWQPPLATSLYLEDLDELPENPGTYKDFSLRFPLGCWDDPENQTQKPLVLDPMEDGNLAICGSIVSGKSTMLQTITWSLINRYTPEQVNIYAIDYSSRMMNAFRDAPHCGEVILEEEEEKLMRFFAMMDQILSRRKKMMQGGSFRQYKLLNKGVMPAIFIMVDNYGAFKEKTGERYENEMIRLSREGLNHGIFLIITGGRFGINDITNRVAENLNTVLTLAQPDRYAYGVLLRTMKIDMLPEQGIRGRGLACLDGRVLEYQTALALKASGDYQRMERITAGCRKMAENWKGSRARRVPMGSEEMNWMHFRASEEYRDMLQAGHALPVGYDEEEARIWGIPLDRIYCFTAYGRRRTGKTNFLKICLLAAREQQAEVYVIDRQEGELCHCGMEMGIRCSSSPREIYELFEHLLPEIRRRNDFRKQLLEEGYQADNLQVQMNREFPRIYMIIGDLAWFTTLVYETDLDMRGFLENVLTKGDGLNLTFIAALSMEKRAEMGGYPVFEIFTGYGTGIHFGGRTMDNLLLDFGNMPFARQSASEKPGIGLLPAEAGGKARRIIIPDAGTKNRDLPQIE